MTLAIAPHRTGRAAKRSSATAGTDLAPTWPVLGAYALLAGLPESQTIQAYRALEGLGVPALEVPLADALGEGVLGGASRTGLPTLLGDRWDVVVTAIPTVMRRLQTRPTYGLASSDEDGRVAAVTDVRRALAVAERVAQNGGRSRVRAVQIHSAPGPAVPRTAAALERSLTELLAEPAGGALLAVEHCDAARPGRPPEKGFLELDQEIAVLAALGDPRAVLTVNWGRSAIEERSATAPERHVEAVARAGLLGGVMFSGASATGADGGAPWVDEHPAPRGADPGAAPAHCLLGEAEMRDTLAASLVGGPRYVGLKITVRGGRAVGVEDRLAVARASLAMLRRSMTAP